MTLARKAAIALTAGLLIAPAPAMAAASATSAHHPPHHAAGVKAHTRHALAGLRTQVAALDRRLAHAAVTGHQRKVLEHKFAAHDNVAALGHAAAKAHSHHDLHRVGQRITDAHRTVAEQNRLVGWVAAVDATLHHWRGVQARLDDDDQCVQEGEEDSQLMADLDTAVADLDAAAETLSNDEEILLAAAGEGDAAMQHAMRQVLRDMGTVEGEIVDALAALRDLERHLP